MTCGDTRGLMMDKSAVGSSLTQVWRIVSSSSALLARDVFSAGTICFNSALALTDNCTKAGCSGILEGIFNAALWIFQLSVLEQVVSLGRTVVRL